MRTPRWPLPATALALVALVVTGCETKPDRQAMQEARHSVPPMAAQATFFDGKVVAHISLANSGGRGDRSSGGGDEGGGGARHGGGSRRHGGGMGGEGGRRGGGSEGESSGGSEDSSAAAISRDARHNESMMPAVLLHLRLENTSTESATIEVRDFNSELGDFAVRPDTLTIAPGESAGPEDMQSLLGVDTYEMPVTLALRIGDQTETKVLILKPVSPPAPPATATPPPAPGG